MNSINDDLKKEFDRIKKILDNGELLNLEDLKVILIAQLAEEELHERQG